MWIVLALRTLMDDMVGENDEVEVEAFCSLGQVADHARFHAGQHEAVFHSNLLGGRQHTRNARDHTIRTS